MSAAARRTALLNELGAIVGAEHKAVLDPNHIMNPGKIFDPDFPRPGTASP
jgi:FAD/FMN-containing dehydrogenase